MFSEHEIKTTGLRQLAAKAQIGQKISEEDCSKKVNEIIDHIKIRKDVDPNKHLNHLKGLLKITINTVHESQPKYKEILEICFSLFPDEL